jgi:hypothetical protein
MNDDMKQLEDLARIGAMQENSTWSSWGSPIGLILFFIGIAICTILVRYAFLMK